MSDYNDKKWREVLNRFLVDKSSMETINGGSWSCSLFCLDEEDDSYQFKDTARFSLANCIHTSHHLQCIVSFFIAEGSNTYCPIQDTPQCRNIFDDCYKEQTPGEACFWAPEDYYNFAKAFLRTKSLTDAFLKPQFR